MHRGTIASLLFLIATTIHAESMMFEKTQTYCFGRYLVDIPIESELRGQGNSYDGFSILAQQDDKASLATKITKKINSLQKKEYPYYSYSKEIKTNNSVVLVGYKKAFGDPMYSIDTFKLDHGYSFITSATSYESKGIDETIGNINFYLKNVRYRSNKEIPKTSGFCFANGFVATEDKAHHQEKSSLSFSLKKYPDVWINIESNINTQKQPSLLERVKPTSDKLDSKFPGQIKRISAKDRSINSLPGQEWLNDFPSDDKTGRAQVFIWEASGAINDTLHPNIRLSITTGDGIVAGQTKVSSLPLSDVIKLYEAVVKTIRLRPTPSGL